MDILNSVRGKLRSSRWHIGALLLAVTLGSTPALAQGGEGGGGEIPPSFTPQNGWWWNPAEPAGRGILIETNAAGDIYAGVLVYDEGGQASWYVIDTSLVNGAQVGLIQKFVGGQSVNEPYRQGTFVNFAGLASFNFTSPTRGSLTLPNGAMEIARYDIIGNGVASGPAAGAPRGGWWWNASENGRGYFLEAQGDNMMFAGLMYNDLGQPVWYSARGSMVSPTLFSGEMILTYGGPTLEGPYQHPQIAQSIGTLTIQFTSDTTATLTVPDGGQVALVRYTF